MRQEQSLSTTWWRRGGVWLGVPVLGLVLFGHGTAQGGPALAQTAKVTGTIIDIKFTPKSSRFAKNCDEIVHVQFLQMFANGEVIKPTALRNNEENKRLDPTCSDKGHCIDTRSQTSPYYQVTGSATTGKTAGNKPASMQDRPSVTIRDVLDWKPYEEDEAPDGWKDLFWQFHTFAFCSAGPECGTWYEGTRWTYEVTAAQSRSSAAYPGKVTVTQGDVPPPSADGYFIQAFDRWNEAKGYQPCPSAEE